MANIPDMMQDIALVVDDTTANHDIIKAFLNSVNVTCESAYDGLSAIDMCRNKDKNYYSLILMDINMPYMNGFETATGLRELGIETPIVAVTAFDKNDRHLDKASRIFDSVLFKPFNSSEFITAISPYTKSAVTYSLESVGDLEEDKLPVDVQESSQPDPCVCDVQKGIANMGGSKRLFTKHFNNFKINNADLGLRIRNMLLNEEFDECAVLCHSIKGLSGMLGLTELCEHMGDLENLLNTYKENKADSEELSKMFYEVLNLVNKDIMLVCKVQF